MTFQLASNAPSNALPTLPTRGVAHSPHTPLGVGRANAGLEDPAALPTPANDNRAPRRVKNWPTGKRLLQAGRHTDYQMLVAYRDLLDLAWNEPANDGWRNPAPPPGEEDERAMEDRVVQRDMILDEDSIQPSIEEMRELSGVQWEDGADPAEYRAALGTWIDSAGVRLHTLGGLEFNNGLLWRYGDPADKERWRKKPTEMRRPHRAPRCDASIAPNSGGWSIEDQIDARQRIGAIWEKMPASSVRILEHALGSLKARELGEAFRKQGKNAERFGVRLIERAIDHLRQAVPRLHPKHE